MNHLISISSIILILALSNLHNGECNYSGVHITLGDKFSKIKCKSTHIILVFSSIL